VVLRTTDVPQAVTVLQRAGAAVSPTGPDALMVSGLPAARVVEELSGHGVVFSEVATHRASLEEAYLELTADAVDYRAASGGAVR
jgi:ABC-2 type transport system ATP-binding protein